MLGNPALQRQFYRQRRFPRRQSRAVTNAKQVGIHGDRGLAEGDVKNHIGGFPPHARESLQGLAIAWYLALMVVDQNFRQPDYILRLGIKEPDGLDEPLEPIDSKRDHLFWRIYDREQRFRRPVNADIGRLGRQNHRDQQRIGVDVVKLAARVGIGFRQPGEHCFYVGFLHWTGHVSS